LGSQIEESPLPGKRKLGKPRVRKALLSRSGLKAVLRQLS
jgi:hypothetical protein